MHCLRRCLDCIGRDLGDGKTVAEFRWNTVDAPLTTSSGGFSHESLGVYAGNAFRHGTLVCLRVACSCDANLII